MLKKVLFVFLFLSFLFILNKTDLKALAAKSYYSVFQDEKTNKLSQLDMMEISLKEDELLFWLKVFTPEILMEDLLKDSGNGNTLDCHRQAHVLGRISYQLYGASVFKKGVGLCHSGFYHGAMESFLQKEGTIDLSKKIKKLCQSFETNFGQFECYHGVGHGVLAYDDYNLPQALKLCKQLPNSFSKESCFGGVFMENIVTSQGKGAKDHQTKWVSNDPHFPCNYSYLEADEALACYHMQTSRMLIMFGNNFDRVLLECLKAPLNVRSACFRSFGRDAAGQVLREPEKIVELCSKIPNRSDYVKECVAGALNVIIDFWGANIKGEASKFCKALRQPNKKLCYENLGKRLPGLFNEKKKQETVCKTFEKEYQNLCLLSV